MSQVECISMKTDAISSYEGSCQGRLSNTSREQSKHRWRKGDGLKLIGKKSDKYNWYSSDVLGRGQNRTGDCWDKSGAQLILFYKPDLYQIILTVSRFMCKHGRWQILVAHRFNYGCFPGTPQSQQVSHWKHYSHSGWLDKDIQKVVMIHPLVHHPSILNSITSFPVKCM